MRFDESVQKVIVGHSTKSESTQSNRKTKIVRRCFLRNIFNQSDQSRSFRILLTGNRDG